MVSPDRHPELSVVVPVLDEAGSLGDLHHRLAHTLKELGQSHEIIFVDDGSRDGSPDLLRALHAQDRAVRVIRFNRTYGQHAAVFAGMERARGDVVVTLDADLQNPPEEIPRLLAALADGADVVGGRRVCRHDPWFRRLASRVANRVTSAVVGVRMRDYGCMLRAYRRSVVDQIVACQGMTQVIPALANTFAASVAEVPVDHARRQHGRSRYGLLGLLRLNFDLLTGFSLLPIQVVSLTGLLVSILGLGGALVLGLRYLLAGRAAEGVVTLVASLVFVGGLQILALGLIGEYVGRIYQEVRRRPRYVISEVLE
jgi:undecaprenyl-phosphate 4-deoxy-4-formamido-L-arabinose transferase